MSIFNILSSICKNCARRWMPSRIIPADRTCVVLPPRLYVHTSDLRERWLKLLSKVVSLGPMTSASTATTLDAAIRASIDDALASGVGVTRIAPRDFYSRPPTPCQHHVPPTQRCYACERQGELQARRLEALRSGSFRGG